MRGRGLYTGKIQADYTVDWTERGPRNVGGRTRTLVFDPNDPSGKKLWAGSVSGGLWVVQNYDSVNYSYEVFESPWSVKVGPNPVIGDSLNVYVTSDIQRSVDFEIFNVVGEKVANVTANLAAGSHTVVFDTSVFAGSTYFMVVTSGDKKEVFRLLVM